MLIAAVPAQAVAEGSVRSPAAETVGEAPARTSSVIQAQQTVGRGLSHLQPLRLASLSIATGEAPR